MIPNSHNPHSGSPDDIVPKGLLRPKDTGKKQKSKQEIIPWATESDPRSLEAEIFVFPDIAAGQMVHLPPLSQTHAPRSCLCLCPQLGLLWPVLSPVLQGPEKAPRGHLPQFR